MNYEEILAAGRNGQIDIYKANELLTQRKETIAATIMGDLRKYNRNSREYKELESEIHNCTELQEYLIKSLKGDKNIYTESFNHTTIIYQTKIEQVSNSIPDYLKELINKGYIDSDGETVLANSLDTAAIGMQEVLKIPLTYNHLARLKQAGTKKAFSKSTIKKAINTVNTR